MYSPHQKAPPRAAMAPDASHERTFNVCSAQSSGISVSFPRAGLFPTMIAQPSKPLR
jgi:hypothetical protein